jgi:hypothetical protein
MARRARPTLRCLREDLGQAVPPADMPLDEVPHPLLAKASDRFADGGTPRERIASVDDQVLFKVKVQRWRGAVWMADDAISWLVAAGQREEGSPTTSTPRSRPAARPPAASRMRRTRPR